MEGPAPRWAVALALCLVLALAASSRHLQHPLYLAAPPLTRRQPAYALPRSQACADQLNEGNWTRLPLHVSCNPENAAVYATCGAAAARQWRFAAGALRCGARHANRPAAEALLAGKWIAFVGDSVTRNLFAALLRLSGGAGQTVVVGHRDFEHQLPGGARASFHWRPYPANATALLEGWTGGERAQAVPHSSEQQRHAGGGGAEAAAQAPAAQQAQRAPDVVAVSAALWHLLHVMDAAAFGAELEALGAAAGRLLDQAAGRAPELLALLPGPEVYPNRMPSLVKRSAMTPARLDAYNQQLVAAQGAVALRQPPGRLSLLDMHALTHGCGEECSVDGVHSEAGVYDAALQVLLNLYRSRQEQGAASAVP